jgi:hypothetical protein
MRNNPGCLGFLFGMSGGRPKAAGPLPYRLRDDFLSRVTASSTRCSGSLGSL